MRGLEWGILYNRYKDGKYDPKTLEARIVALMEDDDVTKKSGIYEYLLGGAEKCLSIRSFSLRMSRAAYERQKGICPKCGKHCEMEEMQADHITPWSKGGKTTPENCQMLCAPCNSILSIVGDIRNIAVEINSRPRRVLGYQTPAERFSIFLDEVYAIETFLNLILQFTRKLNDVFSPFLEIYITFFTRCCSIV